MGKRRILYEIDDATGEVTEVSPEEYVIYSTSAADAKSEYQRKMLARSASGYAERFIWARYELGTPWLPDVPLSEVPRVVFLATHLSYDGHLVCGNHRALTKPNLKDILGVSVSTFYGCWNALMDANVFHEVDGKIYADSKIFRKGELRPAVVRKSAERGVYFTRMYSDTIQQLYRSVPPASVRVLGYIFQILPYVHREFNIVCHNPLETDLEKIQPLKLSEFCDLVGYNKRCSRRLLGQLSGMRITVDGEEQPAVSYEKYPAQKLTYGLFINPNIYYAGSDTLAVELMGAFRRRDRIPERKEG